MSGYGQYSAQEKPSTPRLEVRTTKRLKHVFDNPAHVWAHPREKDGSGFEQTEAWNAQKNFFFKTVSDGTRVLYSYRDSYPIGARFVHKKKVIFLVRSGKPYSVTTATHMNQGAGAVPHGTIKFYVPNVSGNVLNWDGKPSETVHKANLADIIVRINEAIQKYQKAHSLRTIQWEQDSAKKLALQAKQYAKLFSIKLPKLPTVPKLTAERRTKALNFDNTRTERENKKNEAREARWAEQRRLDALSVEEKIAAWRAGSTVTRFFGLYHEGYALLRVKGSNVETSQGVTVPINGLLGAGRLLRFLTACKDANRPYQRNGHTEHIGQFTVESFKPEIDGKEEIEGMEYPWILTAGCHRIKWEEIQSISALVLEKSE